jgi:6-phosphogluconolactonase
MNIEVLDDPAAAVAELLTQAAAAGGDLVLTGGSSPERAYALAAASGADWSGATIWFTDERCVPPEHEQSNFAMTERALLSHLDPAPSVKRMQGELGPQAGAEAYAAELGTSPSLDLVLLGLGPDGHVASLFPSKPEREVADRLVVGVPEAGLEPFVPRISLTMPALNSARHVIVLVTGASKADAVRRAFGDPSDPGAPGAHVRPVSGELTVFLDPAAAADL